MFRDKDEALARLEEELLEEDNPQPEAEEEEEEDIQEFSRQVRAYNGDSADVDLDAFSHEVYDPSAPKGSRALLWVFLLLCGIFCVLAWWVLRYKGVI